ncbi:MAG: S-adenosylmethionine:tRNA ribosyltransferase-isomerase [Deltaproteobacteria bacterium]|nr:S-adenosylmethionine:tRNA ribosyltransferase-isomerase [Deltaproteobacteria bacterium]
MSPATWPRDDSLAERLLVIDSSTGDVHDEQVRDLTRELRAGDLVVVNDAATLPASLFGAVGAAPIELRLLALIEGVTWRAVLFGEGDWHTRTEHRAAPPVVAVDDVIVFDGLQARVIEVSPLSARLLTVRFDVADEALLWSALYRIGHPVQYAHLERDLELWHTQTPYAARPWAVELPSAGRPLRWPLLRALRDQGVDVVTLTHAAGLSATGDDAIDAALPFPERYEIPQATVDAIHRTRESGGRVVAIGTTVVRALEGCAKEHGDVVAGAGITDLKIGPAFSAVVVDALFTGMHELSSSHFQLLHAFAPADLLERAYALARARGFTEHEFGDSCLIFA